MNPSPKFLISIIGLNKLDATKACLGSVLRNSPVGLYALHLTNNGSSDETWEYMCEFSARAEAMGIRCLGMNNLSNEGFIAPNNYAFDVAVRSKTPYFICLNNDTEVSPFWLDYLAAPLDLDPNGALSGPGFYGLKADMHGTDGVKGEYIEGSCLCAKVELVSKYGPLFSDYLTFIYGDDSDLSLRMSEKGHAIYHTPFPLTHPRCTTVKQSPEVKAVCDAAQAKNHAVLKNRWHHYLKVRRMDYPIVLKRHIACGDTLLLTPVIRAIKKSNPLSCIYVDTKSPQVLLNNPNLGNGGIGEGRFDVAVTIDLEMAYEDRTETHIIDAYADAVRAVIPALGPVDRRIEMFPTTADVKWAIDVKARNRFSPRVCCMHIDHGGWPGKNWPKERFAEVATYLVKNGWHVVLVGSQLPAGGFDAFDLTGKTSAMQLAGMMKVSQLFIGGDSFPLHVARAMGCPTIGIFGVTDPRYIMADGPGISLYSDPDHPDSGLRHRIPGSRCVVTTDDVIKQITVDNVITTVERLTK